MSKIIQVDNLSKHYIISHEGTERYTTLRDVMVKRTKKLFSFPQTLKTESKKTTEEFWALKNINFEIAQGDRLGIIGRNGAGKSTLLKLLSRIIEPSTGAIKIRGRVASLLEVGTGFHPELTGRENIFLNGAILGMSRAEIKKHFDAIVDFAEIEKFLDTPVKRYSSGMYVRLAFAVAAHLEPEILIVDEVLAVGDAQFQKKCLGKMEDVSKNEGRTILFVSHNMRVIKDICNLCMFLKKGEIHSMGLTHNIITDYVEGGINEDQLSRIQFKLDDKKDSQVVNASLIKKNGEVVDSLLESQEEVFIKVKYQVNKKIHRWHLTFILSNNADEIVFVADRTDFHKNYMEAEVGTYEFLLQIPVHLLLPGRYFVSCYCGNEDSGDSFMTPQSLSFEIENSSSFRTDNRSGYFYMPIQWKQIDYIPHEKNVDNNGFIRIA